MRVLCKNMTHAMEANKLLYNFGIYSKVEKITEVEGVSGCVYASSFADKDSEYALRLMCSGGILLHMKEKN